MKRKKQKHKKAVWGALRFASCSAHSALSGPFSKTYVKCQMRRQQCCKGLVSFAFGMPTCYLKPAMMLCSSCFAQCNKTRATQENYLVTGISLQRGKRMNNDC